MSFFTKTGQLARRSIEYGERGTEKRRADQAKYAEILQELRNQGLLNIAESRQEYDRPEQTARIAGTEASTEGTRLGTEGERFYQGLAKEFGPMSIRQNLGIAEPESGDVRPWSLPKGYGAEGTDLLSKADVSPVASITVGERTKPESYSFGDAWDRSTRTPIGRALDLENVTGAVKKTWRGLDYIGRGMEKGVGRGFKYLFTPKKRTKREKEKAARPFRISY